MPGSTRFEEKGGDHDPPWIRGAGNREEEDGWQRVTQALARPRIAASYGADAASPELVADEASDGAETHMRSNRVRALVPTAPVGEGRSFGGWRARSQGILRWNPEANRRIVDVLSPLPAVLLGRKRCIPLGNSAPRPWSSDCPTRPPAQRIF